MRKERIRRIDNSFTEGAHFQAEVHIIKGYRKFFPEPADFQKTLTFRKKNRCRNSGVILNAFRSMHISLFRLMKADKACPGNPAKAHHDSAMLNQMIRIEQSRPADTDFRILNILQHFFHRMLSEHLDIVIHKEEIVSMAETYSEIIDGGIVELSLPVHHTDGFLLEISVTGRKLFLYFLIVRKGLLFLGIVLHHNHFQIGVASLKQGTNGLIQVLHMVLIRNNHGNQRKFSLLFYPKVRMIVSIGNSAFHFLNRTPDPLVMVKYRTLSCRESIELRFRVLCSGKLMGAPVIEHLRNMNNRSGSIKCLFPLLFFLFRKALFFLYLLRFFRKAKDDVIILRTVIFLPLIALLPRIVHFRDSLQETSLCDQEMTDVIYCRKKLRTVVRLKVRFEVIRRCKIDFILITVQELRPRMRIDCPHNLKKGIRCELIVMVGENDEISFRHTNRPVRVAGDTLIFL